MSRFKSSAHAIWHYHYHIVWVPKYRFRILVGNIKDEIDQIIRLVSNQKGCEIVELNIKIMCIC